MGDPWWRDIIVGKRQKQVNDKQIINPIKFVDKETFRFTPVTILDEHPNDKDRFAILASTENGKYVRGDTLYFNFNGVDIFTDVNNAIFVDVRNKSVFIKDYHKVREEITPTNPEERQYILLLKLRNPHREEFIWEAMQGRQTTYEYIQDNIDELDFDPEESFVLVDTVPYKDALTVAGFVRYLKNAELVDVNDGFEIDDYCD